MGLVNRERPKYMHKGEDPMDASLVRDKPLYNCSKCNTEIHASDVAGRMCLSSSGRLVDIRCPSCGHVDEVGKLRLYGKDKYHFQDKINDEIHNKFETNIALGKYENDKGITQP